MGKPCTANFYYFKTCKKNIKTNVKPYSHTECKIYTYIIMVLNMLLPYKHTQNRILTPAIEVERTWDSVPKQDPTGIQWGARIFFQEGRNLVL